MSIVQAYKCPSCGKLHDINKKKAYVAHLKKHALKKLQYRYILKRCQESEKIINEIFKGDISLKEFIRLALYHFGDMVRYKYLNSVCHNLYHLINEESTVTLMSHIHSIDREQSFNMNDISYLYSDDFNKRTVEKETINDTGIAVFRNMPENKHIPAAFKIARRRNYIRINNFRYYVYNDYSDKKLVFVILIDKDDDKSQAIAKLISD